MEQALKTMLFDQVKGEADKTGKPYNIFCRRPIFYLCNYMPDIYRGPAPSCNQPKSSLLTLLFIRVSYIGLNRPIWYGRMIVKYVNIGPTRRSSSSATPLVLVDVEAIM